MSLHDQKEIRAKINVVATSRDDATIVLVTGLFASQSDAWFALIRRDFSA
jgi:hypothetical protein